MTGTAPVRGAWFGVRLLAVMAMATGLTVATGALDQPAGASTEAPVVFGDICSCSGAEASAIAPTSDVLQAWESWTNAHGGIDGHKVQVIIKDDALNPATSLSDVQELVQQNHIVGLFDNSDEDPSWATYIEQQKVPVFGNTDTPAGQDNPDFYPPGTTNSNLVVAEAVSLKRAHVKKLADLYCVEDPVCASSVPPLEAALKKEGYGTEVVYKSGIAFAAPNYTGQCLAAKQAGATAVTVGDAAEIVTKVAMDCAQQGYDPVELGVDGTVSSSWLPIPSMQGNIDPQPDLPWFVHNAATKEMFAALDKYAPSIPTSPDFGETSMTAWAGAQEALQAGDAGHLSATPTAAEITNGLESFKGTTLGGLTPPLTFAKNKPHQIACFYEMGINDKKFVALNGDKYICA
jgi:branched-chain amino acid transport system substrate-binding protein